MANPYTDRLSELDGKRVHSNVRQLSNMVGLPIKRPGTISSPSGAPLGASPMPTEPHEDESYKQSTFYNNFDHHRQNDEHFNNLSTEMTKLATGLRKQVEAGYMPPQIAQDNLKQFVQDSFFRRGVADPHIKRQKEMEAQQQDTNQRSGMLLNQIAQRAVMNPAQGSQIDDPTQGQTPAVQNLSGGRSQGGTGVSIGGAQSKPIGEAQSTDTGASLQFSRSF